MPITMRAVRRAGLDAGLPNAQVDALLGALTKLTQFDQRIPRIQGAKMVIDPSWSQLLMPLSAEIRRTQTALAMNKMRQRPEAANIYAAYLVALRALKTKLVHYRDEPHADPATGQIVCPTLKATIAQRRGARPPLPAGFHWSLWVGPITRQTHQDAFSAHYDSQPHAVGRGNRVKPFATPGAQPRALARWETFRKELLRKKDEFAQRLTWPDLKNGTCPEFAESTREELAALSEALTITNARLQETHITDEGAALPPNPPMHWEELLPVNKRETLRETIKRGREAWEETRETNPV